MKKLYIMCGVAFSGKSTLAKKIAESKNVLLVSQDKIWFEKEKEWDLDLDSDEDWGRIQEISKAEIKKALTRGHSVVYDDIGLKYSDRESLRNIARECGAESVLVYLDTPRTVQEERRLQNLQSKERHDVPEHIINWGLEELEIPREEENPFIFEPDTNTTDWLSKLP